MVNAVRVALNKKRFTELRSVICHVTSHPTQVNAPRLNPIQTGWYSVNLPQRDGRLS